MTFRYIPPEEQRDANQYWANVEHKKWVCEFSTGRRGANQLQPTSVTAELACVIAGTPYRAPAP